MHRIPYHRNSAGTYVAKWPGTSVRGEGGPRKEGQPCLGRVAGRAGNVFHKAGMGHWRLDPATLARVPLPQDEVPPYDGPVDGRERARPVCCLFGGCYLLDRLAAGIGYDAVLGAIPFGNRDTPVAVPRYHAPGDGADTRAGHRHETSYASLPCPRANVASRRVSDLLRALGSDEARRSFLEAHVRYPAESADDACCVLVDGTGCPNACGVPITRHGNHNGVAEAGFRPVAVVQRSTGLPIWYEAVPGNVVDVATVDNVVRKPGNYGCEAACVVEDAGYDRPPDTERLVLSGIDFVARTDPTYGEYRRALAEHYAEVADVDYRFIPLAHSQIN